MLYDPKWEVKVSLKPWQKCAMDAAAYLEERGWVQCSFGPRGGPSCLVSALDRVAADVFVREECCVRLREMIGSIYSLSGWNDQPERTQAEVTNLLRTVAGRP
jgi:hypothetical protein